MSLRIATRGSVLALTQAELVRSRLQKRDPGREIEIVVVSTTGDRIRDVPLSQIGDRGVFTKEVDLALLDGRAELAVHSLKDLPNQIDPGLEVVAILEREDARDALVVTPGLPKKLRDLPAGSRVGTSSLRRRALLQALRPDLVVEELRGNLDTRLERVRSGAYDAAILAMAGLKRLGLRDQVAEILEGPDHPKIAAAIAAAALAGTVADVFPWLPAAGQGALAIVARSDDTRTRNRVRSLDHTQTRLATTAERALLHALEGGCQVPVGALGVVQKDLTLHAVVVSIDGREIVRGTKVGRNAEAAAIGQALAEELMAQGARDILDQVRSAAPVAQPDEP
jgi:hydroxymethylbilane synthase